MAFESLSTMASKLGRGGQTSLVSVLQSTKKNGTQELTFRFNSIAMDKLKVSLGSKVDVLHDPENDLWMVKRMPEGNGGMTLSGQENKHGIVATSSVRIVLRAGMPRLSDSTETVKKFSVDESVQFGEGTITFQVK